METTKESKSRRRIDQESVEDGTLLNADFSGLYL